MLMFVFMLVFAAATAAALVLIFHVIVLRSFIL